MKKIKIILILLIISLSACSSDDSGSSNGDEDGSVAIMTANVNGENYNNLQPRSFSTLGKNATTVRYFGSDPESIQLQGTSDTGFSLNGIEINIYIGFNDWKIGSYPLYGTNQFDTPEKSSYVEFFNSGDNDNKYLNEDSGEIKITKFDLEERIIEGTFSFDNNVYKRSNEDFLGVEKVQEGTFKYSLDDEYFDN